MTKAARQASIAVDLGAESCRVSLLRWPASGAGDRPHVELVHRFPNGPVQAEDGSLRWPFEAIVSGVEEGLRRSAELAPEGIASIGVDGWAVDYVRLSADGAPLDAPFCYRDERTKAAETSLHEKISPARLREITGLQLQPLNTLYQLHADRLANLDAGTGWLNLPEYLLARWSGVRVSEYTNATHTEMVELESRRWSQEILNAAGIDAATMPPIVPPGTVLGAMRGPLAELPAFRDTKIIAPACHDTASAITGIPAEAGRWGYVSCGTWSLLGVPLDHPVNDERAREQQFTNIGLDGARYLLQKNMNGMWLVKQCMDAWCQTGGTWNIEELCAAARIAEFPDAALDVDDPELHRMGDMPARINAQRKARGLRTLDASPAGAPAMASLIFHSLAARYAGIFRQIEELSGHTLDCIYFVGGGSRNALLREWTEQATGKPICTGAVESSSVGNFALQLAALEAADGRPAAKESVARYAQLLCATG
ncbi:rhamnulokinase [Silvibacterium dinghuense]|uniref:Carbohydrate kinase n=1 Tax=Silvibacterium dinghuense TaxID=1560006 RepID=A0A4Q1SJN5_9BACT|nr:FGGY family carbohydrate kinase [Silvibacterium dinghuense]RXS97649.1 carbohydrate kinase [Silvibacterium dinghuense]GGH00830.1 carbohydrate kinase [Silvibacterium dinghuense]